MELYPDVETFRKNFEVERHLLEGLFAFASREGIKQNEIQSRKSAKIIDTQIRAQIARDLYSREAYWIIMNESKPALLKAVEVINEEGFFRKMSIN